MNLLNCTQCDYKVINYTNKFCRKQFLPRPRQIKTRDIQDFKNASANSGLDKLNEFIAETQLNSKYCDDFIEWIPHKNLNNVKFLTNGGNSDVYFGTWNISSFTNNVVLKAIRDSNNVSGDILNEVKY